ncbi:MAG: LegC family aminotransferase [Pseudomonadota bacterium]|nr:MAG: LegC family aminotransferase [Pseudomonadota bacterium]
MAVVCARPKAKGKDQVSTEEFGLALIEFVRAEYRTDEFIPLHIPRLGGRERELVADAVESSFVSSVGRYGVEFEAAVAEYTGAPFAVAVMNGTAALHLCLVLAGVQRDEEVITQAVTFVATCNAIRYCHAHPVLVDIERPTLGMSPDSLERWLEANAELGDDGLCRNRSTGRIIRACVPMHSFGHPVRIERIAEICKRFGLVLIEDAAESLGSFYRGKHTGLVGDLAALSFNGNKIITTGGGGMILTRDEGLAERARHLSTTAKVAHRWDYFHDEVGYNYRMPALNAALGCAQMASLPGFVAAKRALAERYRAWFVETDYEFVMEPEGAASNYWLNAFFARDRGERDTLLEVTNEAGVMTRPVWVPMHRLPAFEGCQAAGLETSEWVAERLVNLPSWPEDEKR